MNIKRILTTVIGLPIVTLLIVFGNEYAMDIVIAVVAMFAMYEYSECIKDKAKFIYWVGYLAAASIAFLHLITNKILITLFIFDAPIILFLLFFTVVVTNMKTNFNDAAFSFIGIVYIVSFIVFLPLLYGTHSGKLLIWFLIISAWGTDTFAYCTGKIIGKHKFSRVSPNKTIEGCIGGTIGAVVLSLICAVILNKYFGTEIAYLNIGIISVILSLIGQIGDFSASVIKRYFDKKDFSELFPGHGGMIDRIDSVMFIAPFAYFLLTHFL